MKSDIKQTIYIASPLKMYGGVIYKGLISCLQTHFTVLTPHNLYTSNTDWLAKYKAHISTADIIVYLADKNFMVGKGVCTEYNFAKTIPHIKHLVAIADTTIAGEKNIFTFYPLLDCDIENLGLNWQEYARLMFDCYSPVDISTLKYGEK